MIETVTALSLAATVCAEADKRERLGGRAARSQIMLMLPLRLVALSVVARLAAGAFSTAARATGRTPSANAKRVVGLWAAELASRGLRGPLAPVLAQLPRPRGAANAGALGAGLAGGLVFVTPPVAILDDAQLRSILSHEVAHLSLGHVLLKGTAVGLLAALLPPAWRASALRLAPRLPVAFSELALVATLAAGGAMLSRRLETDADEVAIRAGHGAGLASALAFITTYNEAVAATGASGTLRRRLAGSWSGRLLLALNAGSDRLFAAHPSDAVRIARATADLEEPHRV